MTPEGEKLRVRISSDATLIYPIVSGTFPNIAHITVQVSGEKGPVPGARIEWAATTGYLPQNFSRKTDAEGRGFASFYSGEPVEADIIAHVTKPGCQKTSAQLSLSVQRGRVRVIVKNTPQIGDIYLNGEKKGTGSVAYEVDEPGVYAISWGDMKGYIKPVAGDLPVNPHYSAEPLQVDATYRERAKPGDHVRLTVFTMALFDEATGIPNPLPKATVALGDGRVMTSDRSGRVVSDLKANAGPLSIQVTHEELLGKEGLATVEIGKADQFVVVSLGRINK